MRIKKLCLKGYRNLKNIEINLRDTGMVAFIGNNGAGKSSILENIAETFSLIKSDRINDIQYLFDYTYKIDDNEFRVENGKYIFFYYKNGTKDIRNIQNGMPKVVFTYYAGETSRLSLYSQDFQQVYDNYLRTKTDDNIDLKFITSFSLKDFAIALFANYVFNTPVYEKIKNLLGFSAIDDNRIFMYFKKPYWASEGGTVSDLWKARGFNKLFFDKMLEEEEDYGTGPFFEFDSGKDYITLAVGHSDLFRNLAETPLELYTKLKAMLDSGFLDKMLINAKKDGETFSIDYFSEGEKQLANLLMLIDLTKEYKALFLLDEFDAYLHPNWQRDFVKMVSDINIRGQVFFTTHSPATISGMKRENVFIVENGTISPAPSETFNRSLDEIMEEQMLVPMRPKAFTDLEREFRNAVVHNRKDVALAILEKIKSIVGEDDPFFITASMALRRMDD